MKIANRYFFPNLNSSYSKNFLKYSNKSFSFLDSSTIPRAAYKCLDSYDLNYFRSILPVESILTENLESYNTDWTQKFSGKSKLVLKPKSTEDVSFILKYCNSKQLAVVPQSGNTGLVGGSVPVHDEIIISLSKMNKIINLNEISNTLHCEAGCILEDLNNYLNSKGYVMPLDLGAKGSCMIGGNLATNAGGIHFIKYGSLRANCKGLKFVLPNGDIINSLKSLPKNNTGYDLKQLIIGSEGTLGIITECMVSTPLKAKFNDLALIALDSFEKVLKVYEKSKFNIGSRLSAIEFFDKNGQEIQAKYGRISPINSGEKFFPFYLVLEVESNEENNKIFLEEFLTEISDEDLVLDGVIAQDESQKKKIWEIRETMSEGANRMGLVLSYDISLPLENFYEIVEKTRERVGNLGEVIGYGHIGDYNLHLNICYDKFIKDQNFHKLVELMEPFIYDYLVSVNGSISAEHGIGLVKSRFLNKSQTEENIKLMKNIKKVIDPNYIMNPYKLFY